MTTIEEALRKEIAEAKAVNDLSRQGIQTYVEALNAGNAALEAAKARIAELEADRKRLDARIHRQRLSNRTNWEIVEARGNIMGSPKAREAYCRLLGWLKDQRARAERAEAECQTLREALKPFVVTAEKFGNWGDHERVNVSIKLGHLRKARAILYPPPAGREG